MWKEFHLKPKRFEKLLWTCSLCQVRTFILFLSWPFRNLFEHKLITVNIFFRSPEYHSLFSSVISFCWSLKKAWQEHSVLKTEGVSLAMCILKELHPMLVDMRLGIKLVDTGLLYGLFPWQHLYVFLCSECFSDLIVELMKALLGYTCCGNLLETVRSYFISNIVVRYYQGIAADIDVQSAYTCLDSIYFHQDVKILKLCSVQRKPDILLLWSKDLKYVF